MTLWYESCYENMDAETFGDPSSELDELPPRATRGGRVLDLGCGDGRNALYLASRGFEVLGLDLSFPAVKKMVKRAQATRLSVNGLLADAPTAPLRANFDIILCQGVLHFIEPCERNSTLRRMQEMTNVGGFNVISAFTRALPPPPDMAPYLVGLFEEGELPQLYEGWDLIFHSAYMYCDQHAGGLRHEHAIEKIVVCRRE